MKNILLSQLFKSTTCFNCNENIKGLYCTCEYFSACYYVEKNIIYFYKFSHRITVYEQSENEYIIQINNRKINKIIYFTVSDITLKELFDKIETCVIFQ